MLPPSSWRESLVEPRLNFCLHFPTLAAFPVNLFLIMSAMDRHHMQPSSDPHQPQVSAEERLAEQAREIQQPREQLATASVKEDPALPPLSVPELNKALEGPQLKQDEAYPV